MSMDAIVKRVNGRIDTVIRKSTIELFGQIIKMTPVDTGRAKGNWQCSVGSQITSETDRDDGSRSQSLSSSKAYSDVVRTVPKAGNVVWLSNNVPYIRKLEYYPSGKGGSVQAPQGMVRISLQRFGNIFASNMRESLSKIG
jgi:hypothetical protein